MGNNGAINFASSFNGFSFFVIFSVVYIFNHTFYSFYSIVFVPVTAMIWSEVISSVYPGVRSVRRAIGAFLSALAEEAEKDA